MRKVNIRFGGNKMSEQQIVKLMEEREQYSQEVTSLQSELEVMVDPAQREIKQKELAQAKENLSLSIAKIIKLERDTEAERKQAELDQYEAGKKKAYSYEARIKRNDTKMFGLLEQLYATVEKHLVLFAEQGEAARSANAIARGNDELPLVAEGPPEIMGHEWGGAEGVPGAVIYAAQSYGAHWSEFENRRRRGIALAQKKPSEAQVKATGYPIFDEAGEVVNSP